MMKYLLFIMLDPFIIYLSMKDSPSINKVFFFQNP